MRNAFIPSNSNNNNVFTECVKINEWQKLSNKEREEMGIYYYKIFVQQKRGIILIKVTLSLIKCICWAKSLQIYRELSRGKKKQRSYEINRKQLAMS